MLAFWLTSSLPDGTEISIELLLLLVPRLSMGSELLVAKAVAALAAFAISSVTQAGPFDVGTA